MLHMTTRDTTTERHENECIPYEDNIVRWWRYWSIYKVQ